MVQTLSWDTGWLQVWLQTETQTQILKDKLAEAKYFLEGKTQQFHFHMQVWLLSAEEEETGEIS